MNRYVMGISQSNRSYNNMFLKTVYIISRVANNNLYCKSFLTVSLTNGTNVQGTCLLNL